MFGSQVLSVANVDVAFLGVPKCLGIDGFHTGLYAYLTMPLVLVVGGFILQLAWLPLARCLRRLSHRRAKRNGPNVAIDGPAASPPPSPPAKLSSSPSASPFDRKSRGRRSGALDEGSSTLKAVSAPGTSPQKQSQCTRDLLQALPWALFVLYLTAPLVCRMAFSAFICDDFDGGMSYLVADYAVNCGSEDYSSIRNTAWVAILIYALLMPLGYALLLHLGWGAISSEEPTPLSNALRFIYRDYRLACYMWELVEYSKKVSLMGFVIFANRGTLQQLLVAQLLQLCYLFLGAISRPYKQAADNVLAVVADVALALTFSWCVFLKVSVLTEELEGTLSSETTAALQISDFAISYGMLLTIVSSLVLGMLLVAVDVRTTTMQQLREERAILDAKQGQGRMAHPPTTKWHYEEGNRFACFLSHYKVEAGSDARYLRDLFLRMADARAYLDSTDLVDLKALFNSGVHKSDVFVLLGTARVLTRPWCMMELWEAHRRKVPLVIFSISGKGWSPDEARTMIETLDDPQGQLQQINPWCMDEVRKHLKSQGVHDIEVLKDALLDYLDLRGEGVVPSMEFEPWGTDNKIVSTMVDLINEMANVTGRPPLDWHDPLRHGRAYRREDEAAGKGRLSKGGWGRSKSKDFGGFQPSNAPTMLLLHSRDSMGCSAARALHAEVTRITEKGHAKWVPALASAEEDCWLGELSNAAAVVLLQTEAVLREPGVLVQLIEAQQRGVPTLCVAVVGGGYDFAKVAPQLNRIQFELSGASLEAFARQTAHHQCTPRRLGKLLAQVIPFIISQQFNPNASETAVEAAVLDLVARYEKLVALRAHGHTEALTVASMQEAADAEDAQRRARVATLKKVGLFMSECNRASTRSTQRASTIEAGEEAVGGRRLSKAEAKFVRKASRRASAVSISRAVHRPSSSGVRTAPPDQTIDDGPIDGPTTVSEGMNAARVASRMESLVEESNRFHAIRGAAEEKRIHSDDGSPRVRFSTARTTESEARACSKHAIGGKIASSSSSFGSDDLGVLPGVKPTSSATASSQEGRLEGSGQRGCSASSKLRTSVADVKLGGGDILLQLAAGAETACGDEEADLEAVRRQRRTQARKESMRSGDGVHELTGGKERPRRECRRSADKAGRQVGRASSGTQGDGPKETDWRRVSALGANEWASSPTMSRGPGVRESIVSPDGSIVIDPEEKSVIL